MISTRFCASCLVLSIMAFAWDVRVQAQDASEYMAEALGKVAAAVRLISDKTPFGYDENISLLGGYIRVGEATGFVRELKAGQSYAFLGRGDRDARDLDLSLYDPNDHRVGADLDPDPLPFIEFRPWQTGRYTISLKLDRADASASFCTLAILRSGGWNVPAQNLVDAAVRSVGKFKEGAAFARRLRFNDEPNQWSLFGGVLRQGESIGLTNFRVGRGSHVFLGAGDNHAQDIDSFLTLPFNGALVGQDTRPDPVAAFGCETRDQDAYEFRLKNERSNGASMMFAVALAN